jgi:hypothetical protein
MRVNTEYALFVLKQEKSKLEDKMLDMSLLEDEGQKINKPMQTKYKHRLASLVFAIEILETHLD